MRLEKKKEAELARREGNAKKTIFQTIWLVLSFGIAYFVLNVLENENILSATQLANELNLPNAIPDWVVYGVLMLMIVIFCQFFVLIGFLFANPEGRQRTGEPTATSRNADPYDNPYQN